MPQGATELPAIEQSAIRKIGIRLIPFLFILYIAAYLDRVNVSFAHLQMEGDLGFGDKVYGFGSGIFFIGYFLFEVPSNLILERVGARRWIARIMITWGILAACMMFVKTPTSFYVMRFLLGVAEAGFFPGVILYLTYWYPTVYRGRVIASFMTAIPISSVIGSPISGMLLKTEDWLKSHALGDWLRSIGLDALVNLHGWQWLFLIEGIPSVILGIIVYCCLPEDPARVRWLSDEEKNWLTARLSADREQVAHVKVQKLAHLLLNPVVLLLVLAYFGLDFGLYTVNLWLPTILKTQFMGQQFGKIGLLNAIPFFVAAIGMVLIGKNSDRTNERPYHAAISAFAAAVGLFLSAFTLNSSSPHALFFFIASMSLAMTGILAVFAPFWAMATSAMGVAAVAGGIAFINSIGNLSGYFGPDLLGRLKAKTGGYFEGILILGAWLIITGIAILMAQHKSISRKTAE